MTTELTQIPPPYTSMVKAFVRRELFAAERGIALTEPDAAEFADLTFALYQFFKHNSHIGVNQYIRDRHIFTLAREITSFCHLSIHVAMNHTFKETVSSGIDLIASAAVLKKPALPLKEMNSDNLLVWADHVAEASAIDLHNRASIHQWITDQIGTSFLDYVRYFGHLYGSTSSHIAEAFLVGLFGLRDAWPRFVDPRVFIDHYAIGNTQFDFAILEERFPKIVIKLDDDRAVDRQELEPATRQSLQTAGWKVIYFHRREIENDLDRCVQQLNRTLKGLPLAGAL